MMLHSLCSMLSAQDPVVFADLSSRTATVQDNFVVFATLGTTHASVENSILITDDIAYYYQTGESTAIRELPLIEGLIVFPNPTSSIAILQRKDLQDKLRIRLHTADGRVLLESAWIDESTTLRISIASFPAGIYLLSVTDEKEQRASRFRIVKR